MSPAASPRSACLLTALGATLILCAAVPAPAATGQLSAFVPAARGCAMAHCDASMSDSVRMAAPTSARWAWFDRTAASDQQGLGCSGNGAIAVCTFGDRSGDRTRAYLKAYNAAGTPLWTARRTLDSWAWTSAAMVDRAGGAIAADDAHLVRYAPGGEVLWMRRTLGGEPISPTRTDDGTIVLATSNGPVSAYDPRTGRRLGALDLRATLDGRAGRFDTTNTPGARGDRVYVSTEFELSDGTPDPDHHARLYAIDVDPRAGPPRRLRIAWTFDFGARSGASPLVVGDMIVFDGDRRSAASAMAPRFFGLRDRGSHPQLVWQYRLPGPGVASPAADPRGGAWVFAFGNPVLRRISVTTGRLLQTIDLSSEQEGGLKIPFSAMSIARAPAGHPAMIVTGRGFQSSYVLGLDLVRGTAMWTLKVPGEVATNTPEGQFPVLATASGKRTVVVTMRSGVRALTGPCRGGCDDGP